MVTLDPASATDLDQAFALERDGDDLILQYAIADVAWFVEPGGAMDREAWKRGTTVYLPDARVGVYPPSISEAVASLLPDGPRPAVLLSVVVAPDGQTSLRRAEQVLVRSRAKLGYETATAAQLSPLLPEFAARIVGAEDRRGASRIEFPEQEVDPDPDTPGGFLLKIRPRADSEDHNATMSLAANLAVAATMAAGSTGLFRVMEDPDQREVRSLRHTARRFGLDWPADMSLDKFQRSLRTDDPKAAAFILSARRASGGASYAPFTAGVAPWHSAIAATYAHATAPLRRLADRYVLRAVCALSAGEALPADLTKAFAELPDAMDRAEAIASKVDKATIDLVEAVVLSSHIGEVFNATVLDVDERDGARIQLEHPAVVARVAAKRIEPGDEIRVRLDAAEPEGRKVAFSRIS
jgi:exoribonuclease R